MSDQPVRAGLGKVVYSIDDPGPKDASNEPTTEHRVDNAEVTEAVEESFPASDPPGYAGGSGTEST